MQEVYRNCQDARIGVDMKNTTTSSSSAVCLTRLARELRAHAEAHAVPPIGRESFDALRDDVATRGIQVPIDINDENVILDGHLRLQAAIDLGLAEVPVRVVTPTDEFEYLVMAAVQRRHLEKG